MDKLDSLNQVAEFHKTFKHPILAKPQIPSEKRAQLRVDLITEELRELQEAIANHDIVEIADALCDIQYVLSGAILEFGLGEKFKELFDEVQRSNMSKACSSEKEALDTIELYRSKGTEAYFQKDGEFYLVYRKEDNKTLKSIAYSPADLKSILEK
ncbi:MAG: hypothetical protein ACRCVT_06175 [Leadbetterella sp.]